MSVSNRLRKVREALGEQQRTMSKRFGLGPNGWANYERDGKLPKHETLEQIAALGFSLDWLMTGRGSMHIGDAAAHVVAGREESDEEDVGPGETILRALPQHPIPDDIQNSLDFIIRLLQLGPRNYPVARVNVLHLAELIDEILSRSELDKRSAPTKTSTS